MVGYPARREQAMRLNDFKDVRGQVKPVPYPINDANYRAEEIRATKLFEKLYREFIGMELRRSYFSENDVYGN